MRIYAASVAHEADKIKRRAHVNAVDDGTLSRSAAEMRFAGGRRRRINIRHR